MESKERKFVQTELNLIPDGARGRVDGRHALRLRLEGSTAQIGSIHGVGRRSRMSVIEPRFAVDTRVLKFYLAIDPINDVTPREFVHQMRGPVQRVVVPNGCRGGQSCICKHAQ